MDFVGKRSLDDRAWAFVPAWCSSSLSLNHCVGGGVLLRTKSMNVPSTWLSRSLLGVAGRVSLDERLSSCQTSLHVTSSRPKTRHEQGTGACVTRAKCTRCVSRTTQTPDVVSLARVILEPSPRNVVGPGAILALVGAGRSNREKQRPHGQARPRQDLTAKTSFQK